PKHYHAVLDLVTRTQPSQPLFRRLGDDDWPRLESVFAGAFHTLQPFGSLDDATRRQAARHCLVKTRTGGDGPFIAAASMVAVQAERLLGAALITLLPKADLLDSDSYYWHEPPPADAVERRLGRPHLTWIFVSPFEAGYGVGSGLLAAAG